MTCNREWNILNANKWNCTDEKKKKKWIVDENNDRKNCMKIAPLSFVISVICVAIEIALHFHDDDEQKKNMMNAWNINFNCGFVRYFLVARTSSSFPFHCGENDFVCLPIWHRIASSTRFCTHQRNRWFAPTATDANDAAKPTISHWFIIGCEIAS